MNLYRINLNLLVALDMMLSEQNITNAAKKLFITQSAMSNNLQQLRVIFKDQLLIREKNGMTLTSVAKSVQPKIHAVLHELNSIITTGQSFDPATSKRVFRIGVTDYLTAIVMPRFITAVNRQAPDVKICIKPISSINDINALENGDYELAIGKLADNMMDISKTLLFRDEIVCIMSRKNPLAKKKEFTLKDYLSQKHVGLCASNTASVIDESLTAMGKKRDIQISVPYLIPIFKLIEESDHLLSTITKSVAQSFSCSPQYVIKELPFKTKPVEFYMAWSKGVDNDMGHQWLREKFSQSILPVL